MENPAQTTGAQPTTPPPPDRYVMYTGKAQPGKMLDYLFLAQIRKRYLELPQYNLRRVLLGTSVVGDSDRLTRHVEFYYVNDHGDPETAIKSLDPLQKCIEQDCTPPSNSEFKHGIDMPDTEKERLLEVSYFKARGPRLSTALYHLLVFCRLDRKTTEKEFCKCMSQVIPEFNREGLDLFVAGCHQRTSDDGKSALEFVNVWEMRDLSDLSGVMFRLADNTAYHALDEMCHQEQLVLRHIAYDFLQPRPVMPVRAVTTRRPRTSPSQRPWDERLPVSSPSGASPPLSVSTAEPVHTKPPVLGGQRPGRPSAFTGGPEE